MPCSYYPARRFQATGKGTGPGSAARPVTKSVTRAPIWSCRRRRKESLISMFRENPGLGGRPTDQRLLTSSPTMTYEGLVTDHGLGGVAERGSCRPPNRWRRPAITATSGLDPIAIRSGVDDLELLGSNYGTIRELLWIYYGAILELSWSYQGSSALLGYHKPSAWEFAAGWNGRAS